MIKKSNSNISPCFITKEQQRYDKFHTGNQSVCSTLLENNTYKKLLFNFTQRNIIYASKGKQENGVFSPFEKVFNKKPSWLLDYTHFTFTFKFKHKKTRKKLIGYPVIVIDIDDFEGDYSIFHDFIPNYFILNPQKQKSLQIGYVLTKPIFLDQKKRFQDYIHYDMSLSEEELILSETQPNPAKFYFIYHYLRTKFNGDKNFKLHNAKNPFFSTSVGMIAWTDSPSYTINELYNKVRRTLTMKNRNDDNKAYPKETIKDFIQSEKRNNPFYKYDSESRNCRLFNELRHIAYDICSAYIEENAPEKLYNYLKNIADNKAKDPKYEQPDITIREMVKSIVKFCFTQKPKCPYPEYQKRRLDRIEQIKSYMLNRYGETHRYNKLEYYELSDRFGVSIKTLRSYACQIRKEHQVTASDERDFLAQKIQGLRLAKNKWKQIADMMNISEDTAKKILYRYLKKLKNKPV